MRPNSVPPATEARNSCEFRYEEFWRILLRQWAGGTNRMTSFLTLVLMLVVAYAFLHEGVATAFCMFCNVVLAGLIAFNFWEPIAGQLEEMVAGGFFEGYEDFLCLGLL